MNSSFVVYLVDILSCLGQVEARRMFGSQGLYLNGIFFAIVSDDILYLKTNPRTVGKYQSYGALPFAPSEKQVLKNYLAVPVDILDDEELLIEWVKEAVSCCHPGI